MPTWMYQVGIAHGAHFSQCPSGEPTWYTVDTQEDQGVTCS